MRMTASLWVNMPISSPTLSHCSRMALRISSLWTKESLTNTLAYIKKDPKGGSFTLMQPFLIERIFNATEIDLHMTTSCPTTVVGPLLSKDTNGPERKHTWKYCTLTGMLGHLQQTSRPETSIATHQCTQFNNNPKLCHEQVVKHICKYLLGTMDK